MLQNVFYLYQQGKRDNQEDFIYPLAGEAHTGNRLFVVCDGLGGASKGEEASRAATQGIVEYFNLHDISVANAHEVHKAVINAVAHITKYATGHPGNEDMGTTVTLAILLPDGNVLVGWCGDSRIYHIREGKILWRSKDHSLVQQMVDDGEITEEEAKDHPQKNVILRCLGPGYSVPQVDTQQIEDIREGDYLLLCTDGFWEQLEDSAIEQMLSADQTEQDKAKGFKDLCKDPDDNFSMYLLQW